tara:strand:- start:4834 stop:5106 length:273 start_codon:yes stop_codon:yes gene_type:complete
MAWLENFKKKREDRSEGKTEKEKNRSDKVNNRRTFRLEKINALKEKFYAVAAKRKWLFFIIAAVIVAYLVISQGGFSFGGGWIDKIKSFF